MSRVSTKREAVMRTKRLAKLKQDLLTQFGSDVFFCYIKNIKEMNNIERVIGAQADDMFSQGKTYQQTYDSLSKEIIEYRKMPVSILKPTYQKSSNNLASNNETYQNYYEQQINNAPLPNIRQNAPNILVTTASSASVSPEKYKRDIPKRPKIGLENEWAAVLIHKDEHDQLEKLKEIEAEKRKKELYREELDAQTRVQSIRRQIIKEQERSKEEQILASRNVAEIEEKQQELEEIKLAKQAQKQCVVTSLAEKERQLTEKRQKLMRERILFNESVNRELKQAEEIEKLKELKRKQLTDALKDIYLRQAEVFLYNLQKKQRKKSRENLRRAEQNQAITYANEIVSF